jgi:DNA polymerase III, epsilon subunit and related 3''-5'' exonucleases
MSTVYLDTETTGLDSCDDEILEIAIVDESAKVLLNTLVKPSKITTWLEAQAIHGITPEMVANAPTLNDIAEDIKAAVNGKDVVIYNAGFDTGFLGNLLDGAASIQCCMESYAEHVGEWSDYHMNYRWHKLIHAAGDVHHEWSGTAHRALADTLACRSVWRYLNDPAERERIDAINHEIHITEQAERAIRVLESRENAPYHAKQRSMTNFINHWWLRLYGTDTHWAKYLDGSNEMALVFFGKSIEMLKMEDRYEVIYRKRKDIPSHLKAASHFDKRVWYQKELESCAIYIGEKEHWKLYDISEDKRIREKYPLRFELPKINHQTEGFYTHTQLRKARVPVDEIRKLKPVGERQNMYSFEFYYLYRYEKLACDV